MNFRILFGTVVLVGLVTGVRAAEPDAWWEICDSCTTDDDFRGRALQVPEPYTRVYVTNRESNVTRRFGRLIIVDDLWDTRSVTISVFSEEMTAQEEQAFSQTVQNAGAISVTINRSTLDGYAPGGRDSVVGDLQNGRLDPGLLNGLEIWLRFNGYAGSASQVSSETGADLGVVSFNLNIKPDGSIRTQSLIIKIRYPSGSTVQIKLSADFSTWSQLAITDDDGTPIPVEDPNDPVGSFVDPINDRGMFFDTASQRFIDRLRDALDDRTALSCRTEFFDARVAVICSTP